MIAIRNQHERFISGDILNFDNLGLRLDKLNYEIDETPGHNFKDKMLTTMSAFTMTESLKESYGYAFKQWKAIMEKQTDCEAFDIISTAKVLLETGNASVHEFGVNLNHPWGVPYISGSTLKGLVSSYLFKNGGELWWKSSENSQKSDYQVELFGGDRKTDNKSYAGSIIFNDAWIYPSHSKRWFTDDIINVHHQKYYSGNRMPDGTEKPIPVKIAALNPDINFFVTIQGNEKNRRFIKSVLIKALFEEGIGGKTAVGYGRFKVLKNIEEQNAEFFELISSADNENLLKLNNEKGKVAVLSAAFTKAVNARPLDKELSPLYSRFSPLKIILLAIETGSVKSVQDLNKVYKSVKNSLKKIIKSKSGAEISKNPDAQKIFDFAINGFDLTTEQIEDNSLLKQIAYTWDDVEINENNIDEIIKTRSTRRWPPLDGLKMAIKSAKLSQDVKELALLEIE